MLQETKLLRAQRDKLVPTWLGKKMLAPERYEALRALLFHVALWYLNLGYFDRNPIESWPQNDAGVVLWALSASANDWLNPERLTRLCTVPVIGVVEASWDIGSYTMEARILRPLTWFGLLDHSSKRSATSRVTAHHFYRKTRLFDQFVKFTVEVERPTTRH